MKIEIKKTYGFLSKGKKRQCTFDIALLYILAVKLFVYIKMIMQVLSSAYVWQISKLEVVSLKWVTVCFGQDCILMMTCLTFQNSKKRTIVDIDLNVESSISTTQLNTNTVVAKAEDYYLRFPIKNIDDIPDYNKEISVHHCYCHRF
uniref:Uncharacterized protein n=1 Tax=Lactuca sativa TaxID=4236 RepID=A0A9R1V7C6_LACSA|nr:hypothetical protein LSAT_V11C600321290 [Lactuca sativa]